MEIKDKPKQRIDIDPKLEVRRFINKSLDEDIANAIVTNIQEIWNIPVEIKICSADKYGTFYGIYAICNQSTQSLLRFGAEKFRQGWLSCEKSLGVN